MNFVLGQLPAYSKMLKSYQMCDFDFKSLVKQVRNLIINGPTEQEFGPDSSSGRASASGAGGRAFYSRPSQTKGVKMVPVATLLGAQHYKASTGFSFPI